MDPDEVIILASPQHPIKVQRIKYYDDPLFKDMVERQEGKEFPYPPNVEGVSPWMVTDVEGGEDGFADGEDPHEDVLPANNAEVRSNRRELREMQMREGGEEVIIERRDPDDPAPEDWLESIAAQGDFIDELMDDGDGLGG